MRQRCPATVTRVCSGDRVRAVAAQVGQLAGAVVAADQQMMDAGVGVVFGQQRDPGPGVEARAVAAGAGGVFLPGPFGQQSREASTRIGPAWVGMRRLAEIGQHVAQSRGRGWRPAVGGRRRRPRRRRPTLRGPSRRQRGRSAPWPVRVWSRNIACLWGFRHHRSDRDPRPSSVADTGRGRSGRARVERHRSDTPRLGRSRCARRCRCTGAAPRPSASLSSRRLFRQAQDRVGVAERVDDVVAQVVADRFGVPFRPRQQMLQPIR